MYKSYLKYFVGFFVTIILIIILIVLLFGGGNKSSDGSSNTTNTDKPTSLQDIADSDAEVRMTIAGNVRANSLYFEVQITSSREQNTLQIINGYENNVVDTNIFSNNQPAFEIFLLSLQKAGYMNGDDSKQLEDDRGYCPLGERYIFEIIENGETVQRYWSSSCGKPETYLGNTSLTITLFQRQIPGYDRLTDRVNY